ncbi:MAG: hypothetical protein JF588_09760 [Caulobacterales bacterium]|nr:hypothetical protein [Caulobacterales bacterium]
MSHLLKICGGLLATTLTLAAPPPADAAGLSIARHVQGRFGHGFTNIRTVDREPGALSVSGRRTYDDGLTASRARSVTRNPDGSVSTARSHTGVGGATQSGWSTIYRTDGGYTRTGGVSTSSGRSATGSKSVAVGDDGVTVDRSLTTGSGRTYSSSRTYERND